MRSPSASLLFAAAFLALPSLAGCNRTSDGSVVLARPIGVPGFLRPAFTAQPVPPPRHPAAGRFPPPPAAASAPRARSRQPAVRVPVVASVVKPPFERADPQRPLSCRNERSPAGRIRMVCR